MPGVSRYLLEPVHELTPAKIFDRRWATTLLEQAMNRLAEEYNNSPKNDFFEKTNGLLSGNPAETGYAELAAQLNTNEGALKVAVHRLRQRYGQRIREQISQTVATPEEAEEELRYLFSVLRA